MIKTHNKIKEIYKKFYKINSNININKKIIKI